MKYENLLIKVKVKLLYKKQQCPNIQQLYYSDTRISNIPKLN